jgi:oligopeptide/dipeptide ABC transporter ATP-binding protein
MSAGLLVRGLSVEYATDAGRFLAVDDIDIAVPPGQRLGLVGESGCGKSTTALALLRMIRPPGRIVGGAALLDGIDLMGLSTAQMRQTRLSRVSYIPQGAMNSLNPVTPIGTQIADAIADHEKRSPRDALSRRIVAALQAVDLPAGAAHLYPHQLSGGMKQRACIAIATILHPRLIIADEPTSALDVVSQRHVMEMLGRQQSQTGSSLILIGHDMGLMAQFVDHLAVLYAGRVVEAGTVGEIFLRPRHPYTQLLIDSVPTLANRGRLRGLPGVAASLSQVLPGCAFAPRCPRVSPRCAQDRPAPAPLAPDHVAACHHPIEPAHAA